MKYDVKFNLLDPIDNVNYEINCVVDIEESGAFNYGNGKSMSMRFSKSNELPMNNQSYDIRYDKRYSSNDEEGYIDDYYDEWIDHDITLGYFANKQAINKWIDEHENENEKILNEDKYVCYDLDLRMEEIEVIE